MSRSIDSGNTWDQTSIRVSPIEVISATFPHTSAGDPGRIAIAYLGSENASALGQSDIDGNPWNGNVIMLLQMSVITCTLHTVLMLLMKILYSIHKDLRQTQFKSVVFV